MTAQRIDGKVIAGQIYEEIQAEVAELKEKHGITPGLATVLVGEDPASQSYVRSKQKTCTKCGFYSIGESVPFDKLQNQEVYSLGLLQAVNSRDVIVVE